MINHSLITSLIVVSVTMSPSNDTRSAHDTMHFQDTMFFLTSSVGVAFIVL